MRLPSKTFESVLFMPCRLSESVAEKMGVLLQVIMGAKIFLRVA